MQQEKIYKQQIEPHEETQFKFQTNLPQSHIMTGAFCLPTL